MMLPKAFNREYSLTMENYREHITENISPPDPCPISQENLDKDLSYSIVGDPVINDTQTLYYRDGASIMFSCKDGNIPGHCQGVCHNGSWDPGDFPSCIALGELFS